MIVLLRDQAIQFGLGHVDAEIEVAEEHLDVVVLDLVAVVLGASLAFVYLLRDLVQLLMALIDVP